MIRILFTPNPQDIYTGVDGGLAEGQACADPGVRTPISASGNFYVTQTKLYWNPIALFFGLVWFLLGFDIFEGKKHEHMIWYDIHI